MPKNRSTVSTYIPKTGLQKIFPEDNDYTEMLHIIKHRFQQHITTAMMVGYRVHICQYAGISMITCNNILESLTALTPESIIMQPIVRSLHFTNKKLLTTKQQDRE